MKTTFPIPITRVAQSRAKDYDFDHINFGKTPTDHLFMAEYKNGAWSNARIEPFHHLSMSPLALCLHYGQTVFEGFKAFRLADGNINIFRPERHQARFNKSLVRMGMPSVPEALFIDAVNMLVELEQDWLPNIPGLSLYMRPFVIATEEKLGVKTSDEYLFMIVATPMAGYYAGNIKVKVETDYVRAAEGGTGFAKCGGNYGGSFYPAKLAKEQGFDQVLWTDAKHNEFIEESGMMNVMFVIDGVLITPPLNGSILDGVTRDSLLTLAKADGMPVEERKISYKELEGAFTAGKKVEAFGVGTAAVIAPIELIDIKGKAYQTDASEQATLFKLKKRLNDIRTGITDDVYHWNHIIHTAEQVV